MPWESIVRKVLPWKGRSTQSHLKFKSPKYDEAFANSSSLFSLKDRLPTSGKFPSSNINLYFFTLLTGIKSDSITAAIILKSTTR